MKVLRTDRGGEDDSNVFYFILEYMALGINLQLVILHNKMEWLKKNRIIVEMARSMLNYKNSPKFFWAEVVACVGYIRNMSLTSSVCNMTLGET